MGTEAIINEYAAVAESVVKTVASEEAPVEEVTTIEVVEEAAVEESAGPEEELPAIEPVSNSLNPRIVNIDEVAEEEVVVQAKPVSGYWIEVSGDRDVLVKYH